MRAPRILATHETTEGAACQSTTRWKFGAPRQRVNKKRCAALIAVLRSGIRAICACVRGTHVSNPADMGPGLQLSFFSTRAVICPLANLAEIWSPVRSEEH